MSVKGNAKQDTLMGKWLNFNKNLVCLYLKDHNI